MNDQILIGKSTLDVSSITDYLYISAWPTGDHTEEILALNVGLILSMHWAKPSRLLGQPPLQLLWLPTIDSPLVPMPISTLQRGVDAALPVIQDGYRVLVHCRYGVHRSVAMACCVLIGMGLTSEDAMKLVEQKRSVADPRARHIQQRIVKFEEHWRRNNP